MKIADNKYTEVMCENEWKYNAPHHFTIMEKGTNKVLGTLDFQEGPIKEVGVNGVMNEDLLKIVAKRLEGFQDSEFNCKDNELALQYIKAALIHLSNRTKSRENRGVEGTHIV